MNDGLKQRLIGALVLTGIAVIFLPGFFKEQQLHQVDTRTQIPPKPSIATVVIDAPQPVLDQPLPDPDRMYLPDSDQPVMEDLQQVQAANTREPPQPASSSDVGGSGSGQAVSSVSSSSPEARVGESSSQESSSSVAADALDAWVVQVASLRSSKSAQSLRKQLQERGYKAYVRVAQTSQGEVSRVFIGPKVDKALAEAIKEEVDPAFKVNSLVLKFKP